jgi:hypothetical protein
MFFQLSIQLAISIQLIFGSKNSSIFCGFIQPATKIGLGKFISFRRLILVLTHFQG